jgi:hypothetical protein
MLRTSHYSGSYIHYSGKGQARRPAPGSDAATFALTYGFVPADSGPPRTSLLLSTQELPSGVEVNPEAAEAAGAGGVLRAECGVDHPPMIELPRVRDLRDLGRQDGGKGWAWERNGVCVLRARGGCGGGACTGCVEGDELRRVICAAAKGRRGAFAKRRRQRALDSASSALLRPRGKPPSEPPGGRGGGGGGGGGGGSNSQVQQVAASLRDWEEAELNGVLEEWGCRGAL